MTRIGSYGVFVAIIPSFVPPDTLRETPRVKGSLLMSVFGRDTK